MHDTKFLGSDKFKAAHNQARWSPRENEITHRRLTHWSKQSERTTVAVRQRDVDGSRSAREGQELTGASLGDVAPGAKVVMLQRYFFGREWHLPRKLHVFDSKRCDD